MSVSGKAGVWLTLFVLKFVLISRDSLGDQVVDMAQRNPVESNDVRPKIQGSKSWFFKLRYSVFLGEMLVPS